MMASAAVGVPTMALPELLDIRNASDADTMISGLQLDSRKVRPGDLFLALPGDVHDGRQFIEQAVANGAAAVAAEAPVAGFLDAITVPLVELPDLRFELGALAARSAVMGAFLNVKINSSGVADKKWMADLLARGEEIQANAVALEKEILEIVNGKM